MQVRKALPRVATAQVFSAKSRAGLAELINCLNQWYEFTAKV
jgi:hypothetical protein